MTSAQEFLIELEEALEEYRSDDVAGLVARMDPTSFNDKQVNRALGLIRRRGLFVQLEKAAALFYLGGNPMPVVRRQWAQALIDQNRLDQGLLALRSMLQEVKNDAKEGPEVRGLIGRIYKQRFVNEEFSEDLPRAIEAYREDWIAGGHRWHGINLVSLLKRAERDGIDPGVDDTPDEIASTILATIKSLEKRDIWDYGTAMEAAVAKNDKKLALRWAKKYARNPEADAFELNSTLRQLKEIWQLEGTEMGNALIPVLEYELLEREGASLQITGEGANPDGFEAVYGLEGSKPLRWMETIFERCRSIARISDPVSGKAWGTGFVMRGSYLREDWGDALVLLTNSHVVSKDPADEAPLLPGKCEAEFTRLKNKPRVGLGPLLFSSPRHRLDVSILRFEAPDDLDHLDATTYRPSKPNAEEKQRIYVVGHPNGRDLEVSLYDNELAHYSGAYVRYKSPTEGGNSGSPVFNRGLESFAIHHKAIKDLQVNEGVLFEPIFEALSKH